MSIKVVSRLFTFVCGLILFLAGASLVNAQVSNTQATQDRTPTTRSVPSGSKMKFQGVVIERNADTFTIRDRSRTDYMVRLTDDTSVKTNGRFLHGGKKYPVTDLIRGLIIEVEGKGNGQGEIVADKIRFNESDMRAAITSDTRVTPVEENQQKIAGQIDELYAVAQEARQQVAKVDERVSALDDYDVQS